MPTYMFWWSETSTNKAWFEADSLEHAQALLEQVDDGDLPWQDLPNFGEKNKGLDIEIDFASLECLDD